MVFSCDSCRRYFKRNQDAHQQNNKRDYREQYINEDNVSEKIVNLNLSNETEMFATENFNQSRRASSGIQSNYSSMVKTSFLSPSSYTLPNIDAQHTRNYSALSTKSMPSQSLLVLAYNEQEGRKSVYR
ncbi:unnamed protein product [Rotaria sordida]|uniref:Uncharacterized protein n=1 Tax=Rotaria sordida TaxID=392033 RepID=A0A819GF62_9BILA|nr:unnamed protein product [Rotaria sordida]